MAAGGRGGLQWAQSAPQELHRACPAFRWGRRLGGIGRDCLQNALNATSKGVFLYPTVHFLHRCGSDGDVETARVLAACPSSATWAVTSPRARGASKMGCKSLAHRCLLSSGRLGLLQCHTLLCMAVRQGSARGSTALKPADTRNQDLLSLSPEDFRTQLALAAPLPTPSLNCWETQSHLSLPNR